MPKPILWLLWGVSFAMFWLFVDKKIKMKNIIEAYNGVDNCYIEDYKSYKIARNAFEDVNRRYERIHSKLMFTAQLQGLILMSLALHSVINIDGCVDGYNLYFIIALLFDILGILQTLYALSVKAILVFDYSIFSKGESLNKEEITEFNLVISKMHDRCDFLADMYKSITICFMFSLIATTIYLLPFDFLKIDEGVILSFLIGIWAIYKIVCTAASADPNEKMRNEEINE